MGMRLHALTFAAIAGSLWLAATTGAVAQTEGPGRALAPSNTLKLSANATRTSTELFPQPLKQFFVPYAGTVRVKLQSRSSDAAKQVVITVASGVATCMFFVTDTAFRNDQCDIRVSAGGLLMVTAGANPTAPSTATVRNVRVFYNVVDFDGLGAVLQN